MKRIKVMAGLQMARSVHLWVAFKIPEVANRTPSFAGVDESHEFFFEKLGRKNEKFYECSPSGKYWNPVRSMRICIIV